MGVRFPPSALKAMIMWNLLSSHCCLPQAGCSGNGTSHFPLDPRFDALGCAGFHP